MKKTVMAIWVACLLSTTHAEEALNLQTLLNERNIDAIQEIITKEPNNAEALYSASIYYGMGDDELGTNKDDAKKIEYLKKSADMAYPEAELQYGFYLLNMGQAEEGLVYLTAASDQNYSKATAMLGDLYFAGYQDQTGQVVVKQDIDQAINYLEKAVASNNAGARYTLAHIYLDEDLGRQDVTKAVALLEDNIDYDNKIGDLSSIITLIQLYREGKSVSPTIEKLIDLYYLASLQGYTEAFPLMGNWYRTGAKGERLEVPQNAEAAFQSFAIAAKSGFIDSMFRLGELYFNGEGVEQSDMNAYVWMAIAEDLTDNQSNYSETILELIPKKQRQIAIDNKNHMRQLFSIKAENDSE